MLRLNSLCIGNFALDSIVRPESEIAVPGGAGLRFASGWALYGLALQVVAMVGRETVWDDVLSLLQRNKVDLAGIQRTEASLRFATVYNERQEIIDFSVGNADLMSRLASVALSSGWAEADLIHICPFECENQIALIKKAREHTKTVSSMIHFSSLTDQTCARYRNSLPLLDILFLNHAEAQAILGTKDDWTACGSLLSQFVRRLVFLTLDKEGSAAFGGGHLVAMSPPAHLAVRDLLGAGDCFAGGALAGLLLSEDPLVALRCGSIAAAFALADVGHMALLRFLEPEVSK
jgi:sugar/nucleoside kinase (ribokinase family)